MDKIKEFIAKIIGTSITSIITRIVIAGLSLYAGSATDFGDAVGQVLDKDRSIAAAVELINETPQPEIVKAVVEEKQEAGETVPTEVQPVPLPVTTSE